jgi:DNA-binding NtrC family response regulator
MPKLLIADDERGSREALRLIFDKEFEVLLAESAEEAQTLLAREPVDLALLDVVMPGRSGIDLLRLIHADHPDLPVIMVSASTAIPSVVEAIRLGAVDFVGKPFDIENLRHIVRRAVETRRLHRQVQVLSTELSSAFPTRDIVGQSPAFLAAIEQVRCAAATGATGLIQGESGTGTELAARLLHAESPRQDEPFVAVHCASLPENLLESELFGHEKGAFTNADRLKPGRFELAGSGTLFFDEVGEMSASTQVKLLRVIQEREFMRVGGTRLIRTNARIVAAAARDLRKDVLAGTFRGPLLQTQCRPGPTAASARTARGSSSAADALPASAGACAACADAGVRQRGPPPAGRLLVARECPGTAEPRRTYACPARTRARGHGSASA